MFAVPPMGRGSTPASGAPQNPLTRDTSPSPMSVTTPPATRVLLEFDGTASEADEPVRADLSVAIRTGDDLWVASDETTSLERLTIVGPHHLARHTRFALGDFVDLPEDDDAEVDIEGLGFDGDYIWVTGSHGLKRRKPKQRLDPAEQIERLATVKRERNRYLLARIPCVRAGDGSYELRREAERSRLLPFGEATRLTAAQLAMKGKSNDLMQEIEDDEHLAPFLPIPGKDNGFDIEGLAVSDGRLYLGLRGPVLRGFAVVLSLELEQDRDDERVLRLVRRKVARDTGGDRVKRSYAKHFLDLQGMGIRELRPHGKDLLLLAGPTMALDGTIAVFRWIGGAEADCDEVVHADRLVRLFDVPHGPGIDRAEGMTLWEGNGAGEQVLVVYDAPGERRRTGAAGVYADLFPLG